METITNILDTNLIIGLLVLLVIIPIYYKMGLLYWLTGKNGNKTNKDLSVQMTELREYYNHETTKDLEYLMTKTSDIKNSLVKIENTLSTFENFGIKIRKE